MKEALRPGRRMIRIGYFNSARDEIKVPSAQIDAPLNQEQADSETHLLKKPNLLSIPQSVTALRRVRRFREH